MSNRISSDTKNSEHQQDVKEIRRTNGSYLLARIFLGGAFLIIGLNAFFGYLPEVRLSPGATVLLESFKDSGYLFTFIKVVEVICGLMLVSNIFVPLVLFFVAPLILNIFLFGVFLEPMTLILTAFMLTAYGVLIYYYRRFFGEILRYSLDVNPNSPENFSLSKENLIELGIKNLHHKPGHGQGSGA